MNFPFNWWAKLSQVTTAKSLSRCRWDGGESSTDKKKTSVNDDQFFSEKMRKNICLPEKLMVYVSLSSFSPPRFIWLCAEFSLWCSCHSTTVYLKWPLIAASKRAMLPQNDQRIGATMVWSCSNDWVCLKLGMDVHNCNMNRYESYPHISG